MDPPPELIAGEMPPEFILNPGALALLAHARDDHRRIGAMGEREDDLSPEVRLPVLIDSRVLNVREPHACGGQAVADGLARKANPVLNPPEALFLGGSHKHS